MSVFRFLLRGVALGGAFLLLARVAAADPVPAAPRVFAPGERWVAVGDSITHAGTYPYWIELYYVTRFPAQPLQVTNAGISGDTAEGALKRFAWDIAPAKPTVATVMLGMNDVGRSLYGANPPGGGTGEKRRERIAAHEAKLRELVAALQATGARVVLITPSIYDETAELKEAANEGVNEVLRQFAAFGRALAAETGAALVDFHGPMDRLNFELQKADPKATIVGADRIHPGPAGHLFMAYLFLKAQGVPATVSRVAIDADSRRVVAAERGKVEKLRKRYNGVQWRWTAEALPLPIEAEARAALGWAPVQEELNREILQVTGLKPGHYLLQIDEVDIRAYGSEELAAGVNLALESSTPQAWQAAQVARLLKDRQNLIAENLRRIAQVEHQTAPEIAHPVTLEQMEPLIARRVELLRGTTASAGTFTTLERYAKLKPAEAKTRAEAEQLLASARRLAEPVRHEYRLVRMDESGGPAK